MKQLVKKLLIFTGALFALILIISNFLNYFQPAWYLKSQQKSYSWLNGPPVIVPDKSHENYFYTADSSGDSMLEFGLSEKEHNIKIFPNKPCDTGDICAFTCRVRKCQFPCDDPNTCQFNESTASYIKKLTKFENNCYWFEGNEDVWEKDGKKYISIDSRKYGWLCGNDLEINGLVIQ